MEGLLIERISFAGLLSKIAKMGPLWADHLSVYLSLLSQATAHDPNELKPSSTCILLLFFN